MFFLPDSIFKTLFQRALFIFVPLMCQAQDELNYILTVSDHNAISAINPPDNSYIFLGGHYKEGTIPQFASVSIDIGIYLEGKCLGETKDYLNNELEKIGYEAMRSAENWERNLNINVINFPNIPSTCIYNPEIKVQLRTLSFFINEKLRSYPFSKLDSEEPIFQEFRENETVFDYLLKPEERIRNIISHYAQLSIMVIPSCSPKFSWGHRGNGVHIPLNMKPDLSVFKDVREGLGNFFQNFQFKMSYPRVRVQFHDDKW